MTDRRCGCGFEDVVDSFPSYPDRPDVIAEVGSMYFERCREFADLARLANSIRSSGATDFAWKFARSWMLRERRRNRELDRPVR
jgi:hypothetical protein